MTAYEPPNPYAAPSNALADGVPGTGEARRPSKILATAMSLVAYPLVGTGHFILGRRRRGAIWLTVGLLLGVAMILGVRLPEAKLFKVGLVGLIVAALLAVIDTAVAKPKGGIAGGRALLVALAVVLIAKGGAFAVRAGLIEAFSIPSGAMLPTLLVGDHIFVKKGRSDIARGDVIVFEFPRDRSTVYVKRVIALGGDTVEFRRWSLYVNDEEIRRRRNLMEPNPCPQELGLEDCTFYGETIGDHSYRLIYTSHAGGDVPPTVVPPNSVYVLGDNRDNSSDSRIWGPVPVDHIKGKATVIYWSKDLSRIGSGIY
ncbi:MAG TPA: signal peptidase I [Polyangia bacterium]|nr:signal peptidase I [Polyangia bacterium]